MKKRNDSSILDAVLSCEGRASQAILDAAMSVARKRYRRRRAGLSLLTLLVAGLLSGWVFLRHLTDDFSRSELKVPAVAQSPSANISVRTALEFSSVRVATEQGTNGEWEREPAWRVRTEDLSPAQHVVRVSDDDLLLLAGRKENASGAALVYASEGVRFLVADAAAPESEPFR